jgi:hypothetical protein
MKYLKFIHLMLKFFTLIITLNFKLKINARHIEHLVLQ